MRLTRTIVAIVNRTFRIWYSWRMQLPNTIIKITILQLVQNSVGKMAGDLNKFTDLKIFTTLQFSITTANLILRFFQLVGKFLIKFRKINSYIFYPRWVFSKTYGLNGIRNFFFQWTKTRCLTKFTLQDWTTFLHAHPSSKFSKNI